MPTSAPATVYDVPPPVTASACRETAIRDAHARLLAIDDRYQPSVEEIAALAGAATAEVRRSMLDRPWRSTLP